MIHGTGVDWKKKHGFLESAASSSVEEFHSEEKTACESFSASVYIFFSVRMSILR